MTLLLLLLLLLLLRQSDRVVPGTYTNPNWIRAEVPLNAYQNFYVGFEGMVGGDDKTDIALDDISFSAGCLTGGKMGWSAVVVFSRP